MIAELEFDTTTAYGSEDRIQADERQAPAHHDEARLLTMRVSGEYREMPGLRLTVRQAARLFGVTTDVALGVLEELRQAAILTCPEQGVYSLNR